MTAAATGLRGFARRSPITLFLLIAFGVGVPLMLGPILAARGIIPGGALPGRVGLDTEKASVLLMMFLALVPATFVVTWLEGGRDAVRALLRRVGRWRIGLGWWLVVLLALPVGTVVLSLAMGDTFRPPTLAALGQELVGTLIGFTVINLWEETAWTGFLQTRLERRHGLYLAAALTAIPFAAIHMPLQLIAAEVSAAGLASHFVLLLILGLVFRPLMGLVQRGAGNSLLAVGLTHTMFNRSNNNEGIAALLLDGRHRQLGALVATLGVTVILAVVLRARATKAERARLDELNGELREATPA